MRRSTRVFFLHAILGESSRLLRREEKSGNEVFPAVEDVFHGPQRSGRPTKSTVVVEENHDSNTGSDNPMVHGVSSASATAAGPNVADATTKKTPVAGETRVVGTPVVGETRAVGTSVAIETVGTPCGRAVTKQSALVEKTDVLSHESLNVLKETPPVQWSTKSDVVTSQSPASQSPVVSKDGSPSQSPPDASSSQSPAVSSSNAIEKTVKKESGVGKTGSSFEQKEAVATTAEPDSITDKAQSISPSKSSNDRSTKKISPSSIPSFPASLLEKEQKLEKLLESVASNFEAENREVGSFIEDRQIGSFIEKHRSEHLVGREDLDNEDAEGSLAEASPIQSGSLEGTSFAAASGAKPEPTVESSAASDVSSESRAATEFGSKLESRAASDSGTTVNPDIESNFDDESGADTVTALAKTKPTEEKSTIAKSTIPSSPKTRSETPFSPDSSFVHTAERPSSIHTAGNAVKNTVTSTDPANLSPMPIMNVKPEKIKPHEVVDDAVQKQLDSRKDLLADIRTSHSQLTVHQKEAFSALEQVRKDETKTKALVESMRKLLRELTSTTGGVKRDMELWERTGEPVNHPIEWRAPTFEWNAFFWPDSDHVRDRVQHDSDQLTKSNREVSSTNVKTSSTFVQIGEKITEETRTSKTVPDSLKHSGKEHAGKDPMKEADDGFKTTTQGSTKKSDDTTPLSIVDQKAETQRTETVAETVPVSHLERIHVEREAKTHQHEGRRHGVKLKADAGKCDIRFDNSSKDAILLSLYTRIATSKMRGISGDVSAKQLRENRKELVEEHGRGLTWNMRNVAPFNGEDEEESNLETDPNAELNSFEDSLFGNGLGHGGAATGAAHPLNVLAQLIISGRSSAVLTAKSELVAATGSSVIVEDKQEGQDEQSDEDTDKLEPKSAAIEKMPSQDDLPALVFYNDNYIDKHQQSGIIISPAKRPIILRRKLLQNLGSKLAGGSFYEKSKNKKKEEAEQRKKKKAMNKTAKSRTDTKNSVGSEETEGPPKDLWYRANNEKDCRLLFLDLDKKIEEGQARPQDFKVRNYDRDPEQDDELLNIPSVATSMRL